MGPWKSIFLLLLVGIMFKILYCLIGLINGENLVIFKFRYSKLGLKDHFVNNYKSSQISKFLRFKMIRSSSFENFGGQSLYRCPNHFKKRRLREIGNYCYFWLGGCLEYHVQSGVGIARSYETFGEFAEKFIWAKWIIRNYIGFITCKLTENVCDLENCGIPWNRIISRFGTQSRWIFHVV